MKATKRISTNRSFSRSPPHHLQPCCPAGTSATPHLSLPVVGLQVCDNTSRNPDQPTPCRVSTDVCRCCLISDVSILIHPIVLSPYKYIHLYIVVLNAQSSWIANWTRGRVPRRPVAESGSVRGLYRRRRWLARIVDGDAVCCPRRASRRSTQQRVLFIVLFSYASPIKIRFSVYCHRQENAMCVINCKRYLDKTKWMHLFITPNQFRKLLLF